VLVFVGYRVAGALAILVASVIGGPTAYALWIVALVLQFVSSRQIRGHRALLTSGFALRTAHFAERHGLLLIVAFGESVVAIGIGLRDTELTPVTYLAAIAGLALVTALWWTYFSSDDERAVDTLRALPLERQLLAANDAFFYAYLPMLLGIVVLAAGIALTIANVTVPQPLAPAALLGSGVTLYLAGDIAFRRVLGLVPIGYRTAALPVSLISIWIGTSVSGFAQLVLLIAAVVVVSALEALDRGVRRSSGAAEKTVTGRLPGGPVDAGDVHQ
jgi:low temperature requirement protein LtrA